MRYGKHGIYSNIRSNIKKNLKEIIMIHYKNMNKTLYQPFKKNLQ